MEVGDQADDDRWMLENAKEEEEEGEYKGKAEEEAPGLGLKARGKDVLRTVQGERGRGHGWVWQSGGFGGYIRPCYPSVPPPCPRMGKGSAMGEVIFLHGTYFERKRGKLNVYLPCHLTLCIRQIFQVCLQTMMGRKALTAAGAVGIRGLLPVQRLPSRCGAQVINELKRSCPGAISIFTSKPANIIIV